MYGAGYHPVIVKLLDLVERDPAVLQRSVASIARGLNVSTCHLQHLIRRDLDVSLTHFLRKRRVAMARQMLQERWDLTISEVAFACGYDLTKLYRHFIIELSVSPSEARVMDARSGRVAPHDESLAERAGDS
jgi:transcriptional regulator GlxA family with amidase domain